MTDIVERVTDELLAHGEFSANPNNNRPNAREAAKVVVEMVTRAASEWRDISTAPRDGTIVDLWLTGGGRMTDQWWDEEDESWCGLDDKMFSHWIIAPVEGPAPPQRNEVKK